MEKKNAGYSLVELLVSMAIFGLIMIGVAMIMRTTSEAFGDGSKEVAVQEEAQVAVNQVEELLLDATVRVKTEGTNGYCITSQGSDYHIMLDGNKLKVQQTAVSASTTVGDWELMAKNVVKFEINNIATWDPLYNAVDGDNLVTIIVKVQIKEEEEIVYEYEATKDVYLRNSIETKATMTLPSAPGGGGNPGDEFNHEVDLKRYTILNLEKEFGIVGDIEWIGSTAGNYYTFVDCTLDDTTHAIKTATDMTTGSSKFIRTNATVTSSFGTSVTKSQCIGVSGKTEDGTVVKVQLMTKAVSYNLASGIIAQKAEGTANALSNWNSLIIEGYDVAAATNPVLYGNHANENIKYDVQFYNDANGNMTCDSGEIIGNKLTDEKLMASPANAGRLEDTYIVGFGLSVDPCSSNFVITESQGQAGTNNSSFFSDGKKRVQLTIKIPDGTVNGFKKTVDLSVVVNGSNLSGTAGGKVF